MMDDSNGGSQKVVVVLAGGLSLARSSFLRSFAKVPQLTLIQTPETGDGLLAYCQRLAPCVLIAAEETIQAFDPAEFASRVGYGNLIQVLVVASSVGSNGCERFLRMGCMGLLQPNATPSVVHRAVQAVASGEFWVARKVLSRSFRELLLVAGPRRLTRRELQILTLIGQGWNNREIGEKLFISRDTVRWHERSLYSKIGAQDRRCGHATETTEAGCRAQHR